ncbi:predicted membrane protein [Hahella chejuensis KCTC 2396]|uniref:Predicted membrane protein n=1 Tax=Hahella chejuensis (strain KCTC 2396) TaxID=349521 RepID=Q2SFP6_HAHCH|nr:DoxX family protein [Hahella chejuensis]ABC30528.1 predicted membrane protein [Hahella chejuensis KCTC 2396]
MTISRNYELAALLLRVTLGAVLIAHSLYLKLVVFTLPGTAEFFSSIGLPAFLAYFFFFVEAVSGIALIVGFHSQIAAAMVAPILLGATWAHWDAGWLFENEGGGWEYPLVLVLMAATQIFLGNGRYTITKEA